MRFYIDMEEIAIRSLPAGPLLEVLPQPQAVALRGALARAESFFAGRTLWVVNSTSTGGGVAEMLPTMLGYARGAGVDARWMVMKAGPEMFEITKRIHNHLCGDHGDGGPLGEVERDTYERVLADNWRDWEPHVRPGDLVIIEDAQVAGLAPALKAAGARILWRCHIGRPERCSATNEGYEFLRRYLELMEMWVYSSRAFAAPYMPGALVRDVAPSLDPLSNKNRPLSGAECGAVLRRAGIWAPDGGVPQRVEFTRLDGSWGEVGLHPGTISDGGMLPEGTRYVLQVARWDKHKDPVGVMRAFAAHIGSVPDDVHLVLAGPSLAGVHDDPEDSKVLAQCRRVREGLPARVRDRVHLACLPTADIDENALIVNALQRCAAVVTQKSWIEAFCLTAAEALFKGKPLVGAGNAGIRLQVRDGVEGLLVDDAGDLDGFMERVVELLNNPGLAADLGRRARARIEAEFLVDSHLLNFLAVLEEFFPPETAATA